MSVWLGLDSQFIPAFTGDKQTSQTHFWPHRVHSLVGEERQVNGNGYDRFLDREPGVRAGNFVLSSFKYFTSLCQIWFFYKAV